MQKINVLRLKLFFLLILLILLLVFVSADSAINVERPNKTLKAVQILFRHGDRGPVESAATIESPLTDKGKKQMYELGVYVRARYRNLTKDYYDDQEIYFLSSDRSRTLQSTYLFSYGYYRDFYLENSGGNFKFRLDPAPVHSSPARYDNLFLRSNVCPRYEEILEEGRLEFISTFRQRNPELVEEYERNTGNNLNGKSDDLTDEIGTFLVFQDEVYNNISHQIPIQDWAQKYLTNPDFESARLLVEEMRLATDERMRLYAGPLAKLILDEFAAENHKKMKIYGGHDSNVHSLMMIFGVWDDAVRVMPPIGSMLMIELHEQSPHDGRFLEFWYRNNTSTPPALLEVPGCGSPCKLSKVQSSLAKFLPNNFHLECRVEND